MRFSTLAGRKKNYPQTSVGPSECSLKCFWVNLSWTLGSFSCADQYSGEGLQDTFCISLGLSICAALSSMILWSVKARQLGLPKHQLHLFHSERLLCSTWIPPSHSTYWQWATTIVGHTSFVSHLSGITVLNCLILSNLKTIVSYNCPVHLFQVEE